MQDRSPREIRETPEFRQLMRAIAAAVLHLGDGATQGQLSLALDDAPVCRQRDVSGRRVDNKAAH
jgi:hypothetical protein